MIAIAIKVLPPTGPGGCNLTTANYQLRLFEDEIEAEKFLGEAKRSKRVRVEGVWYEDFGEIIR